MHKVAFGASSFVMLIGTVCGYQYSSFIGPVSGPVEEVSVPYYSSSYPYSYATKRDFVAKPDYTFAYGVDDPDSGTSHNRHESRDGDVVKGEYSVMEPDGTLRTVYYTADPENGFQATVNYKTPPPPSPVKHPSSIPSSHPNTDSYDYY